MSRLYYNSLIIDLFTFWWAAETNKSGATVHKSTQKKKKKSVTSREFYSRPFMIPLCQAFIRPENTCSKKKYYLMFCNSEFRTINSLWSFILQHVFRNLTLYCQKTTNPSCYFEIFIKSLNNEIWLAHVIHPAQTHCRGLARSCDL